MTERFLFHLFVASCGAESTCQIQCGSRRKKKKSRRESAQATSEQLCTTEKKVSKARGWKQVCLQGLGRKSFQRRGKKKKKTQQELNTEFWHLRQQTQLLPPAPILSSKHLELVFKRLCRTQYITWCCVGFNLTGLREGGGKI